MTPEQEQKLRHMLGAEPERYAKKTWGWRNYYASTVDSRDFKELQAMTTEGLVSQGAVRGTMAYFHATEAGCKALGFTKAQIKRAFEG